MFVTNFDEYEPEHCQEVCHIEYEQDNFEKSKTIIDLQLLPDHVFVDLRVVSLNWILLYLVLDVSFEDLSYFLHDFVDVKKTKSFYYSQGFDYKKPLKAFGTVKVKDIVKLYPCHEM